MKEMFPLSSNCYLSLVRKIEKRTRIILVPFWKTVLVKINKIIAKRIKKKRKEKLKAWVGFNLKVLCHEIF